VANPGRPPEGLMEAADSVRRLEALQGEGLINSDEYARERSAVERAMQPEPPLRTEAKTTGMTDKAAGGDKAMAKPTGPQPAVHLASYRTKKAADRGWAQLRRAHKDLLDGLSMEISQINLGPGKGTFFRLKAGPLRDSGAAENVCRQLKSRRQYCDPSFMNGG
jgi:sporulation related protein